MLRARHNFSCYPDGVKRRDYQAGDIVKNVPEEYAAMLYAKGHVEIIDDPAPVVSNAQTE